MTLGMVLPPVGDVVARFERALRDDWDRGDPSLHGVMGLLLELHGSNVAQWELEDTTRDPSADDSVVAEAKRGIDKLNLGRHQLVQAIDVAIDAALGQSPTATLATESPGMVFDRLSVLVIRMDRTASAVGSGSSDAPAYAARLPILGRQRAALCSALEALLQEVTEGRRRFLLYEPLKLYGA
jgi:hypothetical protein